MTDVGAGEGQARQGLPPWAKKTIAVVATIVVLVVAYYVLAAFVPRWWAQRVAGLADGGFVRGVLWGLLFGILCTAIPLALLAWIWQVRSWKYHRVLQIGMAALALLVVLPNLMTLSIVLGNGNAAHAGERILDVDAPGFRGASLVGAIVGAVLAVVFVVGLYRYRKRGRDLTQARESLEQRRLEEQRLEARREAERELGREGGDVPPGSHSAKG
ncbi:hypothetical protein OED52_03345 [Rhodococcus sp. Z13]|uniref:Uncharacterized protein n=1 Tax=Rhodococcus sacchari TaxID=2962047 RepID=A0ACD4DIU5_9NOCA|nr:hypothetical protein [Rhodococcus sp. Z13]UYP19618.1 hypothetical protein OED52_03345 [Rhodococcus sp. Z13]